MPPKYWHYIRYLSPGVGLNFRSLGGFTNTIKGIIHVTLTMQFDLVMRKLFGDKWFQYKTKKAHEKANKQLAQFQ